MRYYVDEMRDNLLVRVNNGTYDEDWKKEWNNKISDIVYKAEVFSKHARKYGLLGLEEYATDLLDDDDKIEAFFHEIIQLIVDGTDPERVKEIMLIRYASSDLDEIEEAQALLIIDLVSMIQAGEDPFDIVNEGETYYERSVNGTFDNVFVRLQRIQKEVNGIRNESEENKEKVDTYFKNITDTYLDLIQTGECDKAKLFEEAKCRCLNELLLIITQFIMDYSIKDKSDYYKECVLVSFLPDELYHTCYADYNIIKSDDYYANKTMRKYELKMEKMRMEQWSSFYPDVLSDADRYISHLYKHILRNISDVDIKILLRHITNGELATSLVYVDDATALKVFENMSPRLGGMVLEDIEYMGDQAIATVCDKQKVVVSTLIKLVLEGKLDRTHFPYMEAFFVDTTILDVVLDEKANLEYIYQ